MIKMSDPNLDPSDTNNNEIGMTTDDDTPDPAFISIVVDDNPESSNTEHTSNSQYEKIFNLAEEIGRVAIMQTELLQGEDDVLDNSNKVVASHIINNAIEELQSNIDEINTENFVNIDRLQDYYSKTEIDDKILMQDADNVAIKEYIDEAVANHTHPNSVFNMYAHPEETTTSLEDLITPGYYKYTGNSSAYFSCGPDDIQYKDGLIQVEQQGNSIIQHVYSTSLDGTEPYIDGRIFTRIQHNDEWNDWQVEYIPYTERDDLITELGDGIDHFTIYESTAGYTFSWKQNGNDERYILQASQNKYETVAKFQTLPIQEPFIFGNLIGHIDVRIDKDEIQVRSIQNKGDYVVGVNNNFFIPRTN